MGLIDACFPHRCAACGRLGSPVCDGCLALVDQAPPNPAGAPWAYTGVGRTLVRSLKFDGRRALAEVGAQAVWSARDLRQAEVFTWAPTSPTRARRRGYDQAELLARALAELAGRPAVALLSRVPGRAQTGRERESRWHSPRFEANARVGAAVVVVDDVITTGATLAAASVALAAAGAPRVVWCALAATP